ncbi:MAG: transposase [Deltaproteobacteria bacterium]|nr:transposase [Deltaproteobacteria bacterium]
MGPQQIVAWTEENFHLGDRRRARALGEFAWALIAAGVVSFAAIGRAVVGAAREASSIARVFHFCHNLKIDPKLVQQALFRVLVLVPGAGKLVASRLHVLLSMDWHQFDNGDESSLRVSLLVGSRAIPLLWYDVKSCNLKGRQRAIEDEALEDLVRLQPAGFIWVLLLDTGFRCSKRIRRMKEVFRFVQRTNCSVQVSGPTFCWTEPRNLDVVLGQLVDFGWVEWCRTDPVEVRLVATYVKVPQKRRRRRTIKKHQSKRRNDSWFLLTNLPAELFPALQVVLYYARRFECEHNFRDIKNASLGMNMEHVHLLAPETYERLMCIVAVASALLWLFGSEAEANGWASQLSPSRPKEPRRILSLVNVGQQKASSVRRPIRVLIRRHLLPALESVHTLVGPNWVYPSQPNLVLKGVVWRPEHHNDEHRACSRKRAPRCPGGRVDLVDIGGQSQEVHQIAA